MKRGNVFALLPIFVFLALFIGVGVVTGDFYKMPVLVAFGVATIVAFMMNRKIRFDEKVEHFCKGAGDSTIIQMVLIFLLAGAFSTIAKEIGSVESTVNLGLSILPSQFIVPGLFLIGCVISFSMGTSMGTIAALAPIGIGIAEVTSLSTPLVLGAVVGGAMFGDNLSMISDTTIAAVRTQGCELKDKFKENFFIVLPAALFSIALFYIIGSGEEVVLQESYEYSLVKVLPYAAIIIGALAGMNVFLLLTGGIVFTGVIGFATNSLSLFEIASSVSNGMIGMAEISFLSLLVGGTLALIQLNGGMDFILRAISSRIKTKKGAEIGIASLGAVMDVCTANNTIAIVMAGPIARNIREKYDISAKRTASLLDIFSSAMQGIIPYGAQLLTAASLASLSPIEIIPFVFYPFLMIFSGIVAILIAASKKKKDEQQYIV